MRVTGGGDRIAVAWMVVHLWLLAAVLYLRFRSGAWRHIDLVEESLPVAAPA